MAILLCARSCCLKVPRSEIILPTYLGVVLNCNSMKKKKMLVKNPSLGRAKNKRPQGLNFRPKDSSKKRNKQILDSNNLFASWFEMILKAGYDYFFDILQFCNTFFVHKTDFLNLRQLLPLNLACSKRSKTTRRVNSTSDPKVVTATTVSHSTTTSKVSTLRTVLGLTCVHLTFLFLSLHI